MSTDGGVAGTRTGTASPIQVTNLTGGKNYHCRVRATNAIGTGPYSAYGARCCSAATAPRGRGDQLDPRGGGVTVAFTATEQRW